MLYEPDEHGTFRPVGKIHESPEQKRLREVFNDDCDTFDEVYGETGVGYNADNHNNGYAELHYGDCDYDDIVIRAEEYEINKPTYDSL